jgi:outer membrane autotransporter protein
VGFLITATDSSTGVGAPYSVQGSYTLTVAAPTLSLSPGNLPAPTLGTAYSQTVTASGGVAPYTYALIAGALPTGLSLNASTGTISGSTTEAGASSFTVQASDANHFAISQAYAFTVAAPTVVIGTASLPNGQTGSSYSQTIVASGGTAPYTYAVTAGTLPTGLSLTSNGTLSGTPTANASYSFTVTASDSSSGTGAPFTAQHNYTVVIAPQTPIAGNDSVATTFATPVTIDLATVITGGAATSVAVATPPSHGTATVSGTSVTYTPASGYAGSDSFTYTASNSGGTSAPGTVTINVQQQPPIAGAVSASVQANSANNAIALPLSGGPATAVAVASTPAHGSASVSGMSLSYTPADNYAGQDSLTYTVSGPGGTSAPATVTITVAPLAVPTAVTQNASVLAGKSVTIHATAGASGGPFTAVAIVNPPSSGSAQVSGTDIVFTAAADSPATVDFTYSVANAFGVSAPAHVVVTVNPLPVAASSHVSAVAGTAVQVNLSTGATGGPFTAAALLGMTPADAGQASISRNGAGDFILAFVPAMTSSGTATISFTLSNAYATSAPGTVTVAITPRSDPSRDPEVLGLLNSQADATRRFATAQIANFQQRLESLHQGAVGAFSNQLSFSSASDRHRALARRQADDPNDPTRRYLIDPRDPVPERSAPAEASEMPAYWSVWAGGAVNFGSTDRSQTSRGEDFTTSGVSVGADHAFSPELAAGAGIGYSHDSTDIGHHGTRNRGDGYSAALYASYHPEAAIYLDALIGYQRLSFDSRRYVTDNGNLVNGSRDGHQWFGSLAAGYDVRRGELSISPYVRLDLARASLDAYSERGDAIYALDYHRQTVKTSTSSLGVHFDYRQQTAWGIVAPRLRLEYEHDFQGAGQAIISYSDLIGGPLYSARLSQYGQDRGLIGLGAALQTPGAWILRVEYQYQFSSGSLDGQSILLNLNKSF